MQSVPQLSGIKGGFIRYNKGLNDKYQTRKKHNVAQYMNTQLYSYKRLLFLQSMVQYTICYPAT